MICYHGTPISGSKQESIRFLTGRHALASYADTSYMDVVAECCASFILDSGAFSAWKQGSEVDVGGYACWCEEWRRHPGYDWALIPDVIDGSEEDNDALLEGWPSTDVPVWHLHESLDRLARLAFHYHRVAIGSSGKWPTPGTQSWWNRINQALWSICDERGNPLTKLHGLRMLDPAIFTRLPFSSADSANAGINAGSIRRFGQYPSPSAGVRAEVIATRIESYNSAPVLARETEPLWDTSLFTY